MELVSYGPVLFYNLIADEDYRNIFKVQSNVEAESSQISCVSLSLQNHSASQFSISSVVFFFILFCHQILFFIGPLLDIENLGLMEVCNFRLTILN